MLPSYLLRIGLVSAGAMWRGRTPLLEPVRTPMRVWPADVDTYGHLNNGRFLTLMDFGRLEHMLRTGMLQYALQHGWRPVVASVTARFRRELPVLSQFDLVTQLRGWDDKWFYYEHRFEQDGQLCALGYIQGVTKRAGQTIHPKQMAIAGGYDGPSPELDGELGAWIRSLPKAAARTGTGPKLVARGD